jgi:hypothetical protein
MVKIAGLKQWRGLGRRNLPEKKECSWKGCVPPNLSGNADCVSPEIVELLDGKMSY